MTSNKGSSMLKYMVALLTLTCCKLTVAREGPEFWRKIAKDNLNKYLNHEPNKKIARNIVLMVGDGMGISTVTAARILKGQLSGQTGEETELNFETFPYTSLVKPYSVNYQVPDSAATMTAITSGVKTNAKTLGVDSSAKYNTCHDVTKQKLSNVLHWAQEAGKSTGFVTTSRVTHATPAALYAFSTNRDWEGDRDLPYNADSQCMDIASQLVYNASDIQVILGGGAQKFVPITMPDPTTGKIDYLRQRLKNISLIQEWEEDKRSRNLTYSVVHNSQQLENVDHNVTDYLFGLFHKDHMSYDVDRDNGSDGEPSLADMTRKAIKILNKNKDGYFLMVEGARIDHGHHMTQATRALTDTLAFERAVQTVLDMTDESETLIIVTADHSHTMTMSGYPTRGNRILDIVKENGKIYLGGDGLPYTTLMYANGPKSRHNPRPNLTNVDTSHKNFQQNSVLRFNSETHSGEDIAVYAKGPMAHLLTGVKEQNVIAYVMAHAACIGNIGISCEKGRPDNDEQTTRVEEQCDDISNQNEQKNVNNQSDSIHQSIDAIFFFLHMFYAILYINS